MIELCSTPLFQAFLFIICAPCSSTPHSLLVLWDWIRFTILIKGH